MHEFGLGGSTEGSLKQKVSGREDSSAETGAAGDGLIRMFRSQGFSLHWKMMPCHKLSFLTKFGLLSTAIIKSLTDKIKRRRS